LRRSQKPIVIAARRSPLARAQAELVGRRINRLHPKIEVQYRWVESQGDKAVDQSLVDQGGKGLFTKDVERLLLAGEADLAVHSLKDLPATDTTGLVLAAVPRRADVRDCLITPQGLASIDDLPQGAVVGTASPRRAAHLMRLRPDLNIDLIRGNVQTRLDKVLSPDGAKRYDATLLAIAGLTRLGLTEQAAHPISLEDMLPAACQGALAVQCRANDHVTLTRCLPLNNPEASTAVHAERQVIAGLGADCNSPISVLAEQSKQPPTPAKRNADAHWFRLRIRVLSADGSQCLETDDQVKTKDLRRLIKQTIKDLKGRGAQELLKSGREITSRQASPQVQPATTSTQAGPMQDVSPTPA
jgi:hydroxymethylbilane synthase